MCAVVGASVEISHTAAHINGMKGASVAAMQLEFDGDGILKKMGNGEFNVDLVNCEVQLHARYLFPIV
jgi:hypothetical protein